jgi:hypothetical protein
MEHGLMPEQEFLDISVGIIKTFEKKRLVVFTFFLQSLDSFTEKIQS